MLPKVLKPKVSSYTILCIQILCITSTIATLVDYYIVISKFRSENAAEDPSENATDDPLRFLRRRFLVCNLLTLVIVIVVTVILILTVIILLSVIILTNYIPNTNTNDIIGSEARGHLQAALRAAVSRERERENNICVYNHMHIHIYDVYECIYIYIYIYTCIHI